MEFNCGQNTFVPFISSDEMIKNDVACIVSTKHMAISMMEKFRDKSFEELHLENYNAKKSSFGKNNEDFSASKKNSTNDPVTNENNQFNDIKDLMDELVKTLCKIMLKVNQTAFNNLTPSTANETQSSSFPSASIKITPSSTHPPKSDHFLANFPFIFNTTTMMSTEPSTNVTNSFKFNCTPPTNNVSFAPTTKSFFNTPMVNHIPTFGPVQSNKDLFPLRNTNSNASTISTWSSTPFTKSVFDPKQSIFSKTTTTKTASSTSNNTFQSDPFFKPSGFIFNPTTSSSCFLNKTSRSTTRSDSFIKQPTSSNHSCWFNSPLDNFFTKSTTTPAAFNSFPSSNFNNNAKSSANFFHSHLNKQNQNSFSTRPSSPPLSDLTLTNGIYVHKPYRKNKRKEIGEKKELNVDEFVLSIINCTETLENIAFKAHKSKLIGICEKYNTHKTNILKSTFVQLQVLKSRFKSYEKFAFINESAGFLNATVRDNILCGNKFNPQLYYSAIVLCLLKDDIDSFPFGDLTQIGEIGIELSDAQKQKIGLARAYYENQDVYFLHNAFDKIGSKDARFIFEALILGALKEKVIILMDDNPSHFGHCNTIYMLSKGTIVEKNDHKSLLENNEFYAALFKKHDFSSVVTEKSNENDNTESKKGIQEEIDDGSEMYSKYLGLDKKNEEDYIDFPNIQNENQISNIEIKTPDQQDDNQEKQLDEPAKDEPDEKSIDTKNDEIENDFELC
ncbi:uncharacterized protein LOC123263716 [Cotesia glomerata]|uniref:ABC transporter domain-containing protein n=1 Tax=Cotesia glomerata TaxID=32391 RepID=A0AAV7J8Z4_COTGL|nr:uncharacterized protein LOC123263716 [Cotesia glomerata]KAH0568522.1 hypothetical protein KQX54_021130 [Cotesia glomerata]